MCTGAALLAAAGVLDGLPATSNKRAFAWVRGINPCVDWRGVARWVRAGKYYTASGISAGMDMTLGFIADLYGTAAATAIANRCEYRWQDDPAQDEFADVPLACKKKPLLRLHHDFTSASSSIGSGGA